MSEAESESGANPGTESESGASPGTESESGANPGTESESGATAESEAEATVWGGKRFVLLIYASLVVVTGVFGYIIGLARPENLDPRLLGVVSLPPTPAGVAAYGMVTVALVLGVLLLGVNYVSKRYDTAAVDGRDHQ